MLVVGFVSWRRPTKKDKVTNKTDTKSISVESAMILGLIPCLTEPKIAVGRVSIPAPFTKLVMMKSSSEMIKANKKPDRMPGHMRGISTYR